MSILGIDFGTAFSFPSFMSNGSPCSLLKPSVNGTRGIPSILYYDKSKGVVVGTTAEKYMRQSPTNGVVHIKRNLLDSPIVPYDHISLDGKLFTKQEICAKILATVVDIANKQLEEEYLEEKATEAVLTIPATFGHIERTILQKALETPKSQGGSGLKLRGFLPEPVAAAIDYSEKTASKNRVLVYDLGAGTFDIALLEPTRSDRQPYRVKDTAGISKGAAGNDFDTAFADFLVDRIGREHGFTVQKDTREFANLLNEARDAKEKLSEEKETILSYQFKGDFIELDVKRSEFEGVTHSVLQRSMDLTRKFVRKHNLYDASDLVTILVGGSSHIRQVQTSIQQITGSNVKVLKYRPEQAISFGAARYAVNESAVLQVAPHSYGVENSKNGIVIILQKGVPLPTEWKYQSFFTASPDQTETPFNVFETDSLVECPSTNGKKLYTVHVKWDKPVPQGTSCPAEMRLTKDGSLEIRATNSVNGKPFEGSIVLS